MLALFQIMQFRHNVLLKCDTWPMKLYYGVPCTVLRVYLSKRLIRPLTETLKKRPLLYSAKANPFDNSFSFGLSFTSLIYIAYTSECNSRDTRSSTSVQFYIPKPNCELFQRSFMYSGAVIWNSLPCDVNAAISANSFKSRNLKWRKLRN